MRDYAILAGLSSVPEWLALSVARSASRKGLKMPHDSLAFFHYVGVKERYSEYTDT
jgi:hypothetical protein